jgi:hypothetical protein
MYRGSSSKFQQSDVCKLGTKPSIPFSQRHILRTVIITAKVTPSKTVSHDSIYDMYVIQNDAISRLEGDWLRAMTSALGSEFFQSITNQTISLLTILAGALTLDAPIPPYLSIPRAALFRVLMTEREPEEMSLKHVGETGYAVFAAMSVSSRCADQEVERCVGLVRSLVGEVELRWDDVSV